LKISATKTEGNDYHTDCVQPTKVSATKTEENDYDTNCVQPKKNARKMQMLRKTY